MRFFPPQLSLQQTEKQSTLPLLECAVFSGLRRRAEVRQLGCRERIGSVHGPEARGWRYTLEGQEPRHVTDLRRRCSQPQAPQALQALAGATFCSPDVARSSQGFLLGSLRKEPSMSLSVKGPSRKLAMLR